MTREDLELYLDKNFSFWRVKEAERGVMVTVGGPIFVGKMSDLEHYRPWGLVIQFKTYPKFFWWFLKNRYWRKS